MTQGSIEQDRISLSESVKIFGEESIPYPDNLSAQAKEDVLQVLLAENQALRARNQTLEARIANLTLTLSQGVHDLRNPLSSVIGFAGLLQKDLDRLTPDQIQKFSGLISKNAHGVNEEISKVLESIVAYKKPEPEVIPVANFLQSIVEDNANVIESDNIHLTIVFPNKPARIYIDPRKLVSVYRPYILNASHAMANSGDKKLTIGAEIVDGCVISFIEDNGKGMTEEAMQRCYENGFSTKKGTSQESTGIGLSIAKQIIEECGGTVLPPKSQLGTGTTFAIAFPLYREN